MVKSQLRGNSDIDRKAELPMNNLFAGVNRRVNSSSLIAQ